MKIKKRSFYVIDNYNKAKKNRIYNNSIIWKICKIEYTWDILDFNTIVMQMILIINIYNYNVEHVYDIITL